MDNTVRYGASYEGKVHAYLDGQRAAVASPSPISFVRTSRPQALVRYGACLTMAFLCSCLAHGALTYYVSPQGSDSNDGQHKDRAFLTPEYALSKAGDGDSVYFAPHVYTLTNTPLIKAGNVHLYGMGSTSDDVVFDAGGRFRCLDVASDYGTVWTGIVLSGITFKNGFVSGNENGSSYNSWKDCGGGVRLSKGYGSTKTADGAVIANCAFIGCTNLFSFGGGLKIQCGTTISNCVFRENFAGYGWGDAAQLTDAGGGAIYFQPGSADIKISECIFERNVGSNGVAAIGGGIYNGTLSEYGAIIKRCTFRGNVSQWSGTVNKQGAGVVGTHCEDFDDCMFVSNRAVNISGGHYVGGGVQSVKNIAEKSRYGKPIVYRGCSFDGNFSAGFGGCLFCACDKALLITNCMFKGNSAGVAGAAIFWGVHEGGTNGVQLTYSSFIGNATSAQSSGGVEDSGAVWVSGAFNVVRDCIFEDNKTYGSASCLSMVDAVRTSIVERCTFNRNAVLAGSSGVERAGGAIWANGAGVHLRNLLFVANTNNAGAGSGIYLYGRNGKVSNCTFVDGRSNESGLSKKGSAIAFNSEGYEVRNCLLFGCRHFDATRTTSIGSNQFVGYTFEDTEGTPRAGSRNRCGIMFSFADASHGDYTPLTSGSGRDCGLDADWMTLATDYTGRNKRVLGRAVDIGCFECVPGGLILIVR